MSEYVQVYSYRHHYKSGNAITVPVTLTSGSSANIDLLGKLDTGSTFCIFERAYAGLLGLDLRGRAQATVRDRHRRLPRLRARSHALRLRVRVGHTVVYFAEPESFGLNVLGRVGFLDHLRLGVIDYERLLYLRTL